jgi:hypothetical protein
VRTLITEHPFIYIGMFSWVEEWVESGLAVGLAVWVEIGLVKGEFQPMNGTKVRKTLIGPCD